MIKNTARNSIIARDVIFCEDYISKFMGLMFSTNQKKNLVFKFNDEKIISLHMLFVFYPIDVIFLDKNKIVVDIKENFRPFTFYNSKKKAMYAIELPARTIKKSKTEIGDKIKF